MARCSKCGTEVPNGAKFCPNCGAVVEQKPAHSICPQCAQEIDPKAAFCPNCGFKMGQHVSLSKEAPAPQPQSQPAPQPYPQQAPQPQYQPQPQPQPYYPQQPVPGYNQNASPNRGPLNLVRSIVVNSGLFLVYLFFLLVLIIPLGGSVNYFAYLGNLFNFTYVAELGIMYRIIEIMIAFLPTIGFLSLGTVGLVSGIRGLIRKEMPKYGSFGYLFGFYIPMFVMAFGQITYTHDYAGITFPVFMSPAFAVFFVGFIFYLIFGLVGAFMTAIIEKKPIAGPIFKAASAFIGIFLFIFIFGATITVCRSPGASLSPMYLYSNALYLMSSSSE